MIDYNKGSHMTLALQTRSPKFLLGRLVENVGHDLYSERLRDMKAHCYECGYVNVNEVTELQETIINGIKVEYNAKILRCSKCDEEIVDKDYIEANLKKAHEVYYNMQKG